MYDCAFDGSVVPVSEAPARVLDFPHGALQIAAGEDDVALLAGVDHGVRIGEARGDGLVG